MTSTLVCSSKLCGTYRIVEPLGKRSDKLFVGFELAAHVVQDGVRHLVPESLAALAI
jgi:hypothetical protein